MTTRLFQVNVSSHRDVLLRPLRIALVLVSLGCLGLTAWDLERTAMIPSETKDVEKAVSEIRASDQRLQERGRKEQIDVSDTALQRLPQQVTFANNLISKRAFSWTHFLGDLEEAIPPRVSINNIRIEGKDTGMMLLSGVAMTLKDRTDLITSLEDHPAFQDVSLLQDRIGEHSGTIEFSLKVHYLSQRKEK